MQQSPCLIVFLTCLSVVVKGFRLLEHEEQNSNQHDYDTILESRNYMNVPSHFLNFDKDFEDKIQQSPLPARNKGDREDLFKYKISYDDKILQSLSREKEDSIKDLFFRFYTKTIYDDQQDRIEEEPNKPIINNNRMSLYQKTRLYFCMKMPFLEKLTCPENSQDAVSSNAALSRLPLPVGSAIKQSGGSVQSQELLRLPETVTEKICFAGFYVPEFDLCLFYVLLVKSLHDADKYCSEVTEGGALWKMNSITKFTDEILVANDVVPSTYSAWVDAAIIGRNLSRETTTSPDHRWWLHKFHNETKSVGIILNRTREGSFLTYTDENELNHFICQGTAYSGPLDSIKDAEKLKAEYKGYEIIL